MEILDRVIPKDDAKELQRNLIISHSCGVGNPLDEEIVRAIMLLRINALSKGYSGIRLQTLEVLISMVNEGVHPIIPEKGSLGGILEIYQGLSAYGFNYDRRR